MLLQAFQHARTNLPGPRPLDLLAAFPNEPLALLYSGDNIGHTVLARKPLVALSAADEHSPLRWKSARDFPWSDFHAERRPLLDQWESALHTVDLFTLHHALTGWIGHFSYDLARTLEPLPSLAADDHPFPLLHWQLFDDYFLFDHATNFWSAVITTWHGRLDDEARLDAMEQLLRNTRSPMAPTQPRAALVESMPRDTFLRSIDTIKNYIAAGDIFQANFAQRWKFHAAAHPIDLFRRIMDETPSRYAALLIDFTADGTRRAILSASPELLIQRTGTHLLTRPIKGTRLRDLTDLTHDAALREELLHSAKDQAELAMIVDLLRNDLGRIAQYGSVKVTHPRVIEALPTLWHAHADIEAKLFTPNIMSHMWTPATDPRLNTFAHPWSPLIRALFPGGSVTGAPKIRATQIIEELEPHRRGVYCGSIGCVSQFTTPLDQHSFAVHPAGTFNLAIRTIQMLGDIGTLHAGSGIVADSDPAQEYEETLHKAAAFFRALSL